MFEEMRAIFDIKIRCIDRMKSVASECVIAYHKSV